MSEPYYTTLDPQDLHLMLSLCGRATLTSIDFNLPEKMANLEKQSLITTVDGVGVRVTGLGLNVLENYFDETSLQKQIQDWGERALGFEVVSDIPERAARFNEECAELLQACGYSFIDYIKIGIYVWSRDIGEKAQEVGGVFSTLAILCSSLKLDMLTCAKTELARIWMRVDEIRIKQSNKPHASPLPGHVDKPVTE